MVARRKRAIASASVMSIAASVFTVFAVVSPGYPAADVTLNDGSVWVTNSSRLLTGRINRQIDELDAAVTASTTDFDVLQDADTVFLHSPTLGTLERVNVSYVALEGGGPLPAGMTVALGGPTVAALDPGTGSLWVRSAGDVLALDVSVEEPDEQLGSGAAMTVGLDGTVHAVSVERDELVSLTAASATEPTRATRPLGLDVRTALVTAVGGEPLVVDVDTRQLIRPDGSRVRLPEDTGTLVAQRPGPADAGVLLAADDELLSISLEGEGAVTEVAAGTGTPTEPVRLGGCAHAAWSGQPSYVLACDGAEVITREVPQATPDGALRFRVNRDVIVLNELSTGNVWMLNEAMTLVQNWEQVTPREDDAASDEESDEQRHADDLRLDRQEENQPPEAVDDFFGARPGRQTLLPLLDNDIDPDGDVLTITDVSAPSAATAASAQIVGNGRALQFTSPVGPTGEVQFTYSIADGRGGNDDATVTVDVRPMSVNSPPVQVRRTQTIVEQGTSVSHSVLSDWIDPDGDDLVLEGAALATADTVRFKADGRVTFLDSGTDAGRKPVALAVSDGREATVGELMVDVRPAGQLLPTATPDILVGFPDQILTVSPLTNDTDPNGDPLRLSAVTSPPGATVVPDYTTGLVSFTAPRPGTYYMEYVVTDGPNSADGLIRVDIQPQQANTPPITVRDLALLPFGESVVVDVLVNDIDADGDVLVVQGIDVPGGSGLSVELLEHRSLRISAPQALQAPVTMTYTVSDGTVSRQGQVVVVDVPTGATNQPPTAVPDTATVRAGDVLSTPVLANDSDPDGDLITLSPELAENVAADEGLLFAAGDLLRYQAPAEPGTATAVYTITDTQQQAASAQLTIYVRAADDDRNASPQPKPLTARVLTNGTVRIPVPLLGIDPDGDSVQLMGIEAAPQRGRILESGPDYLLYEAFGQTGTDEFTYSVDDRLGARGSAPVRVGIAEPPSANQPPVAVDDMIVVRPDRAVAVPVLANDSDPDGDRLEIVPDSLIPPPGMEAEVSNRRIRLVSPSEAGTVTIPYSITDGRGGTATAFVVVETRPDAPLLPPIAGDDVVAEEDLDGGDTVDVQVLANDDDPDGLRSELNVSLVGTPSTATVIDGRQVRVTLTGDRQTLPYTITDPDGLTATAFVFVPGTANLAPRLRVDAPELEVEPGTEVVVELGDHVEDPEGQPVRLTDQSRVSATNSDGSPLVVGPTTLRFAPAPEYVGPASLTLQVTDGSGPEDPAGRTATLTLPIEVRGAGNQPPVFASASMDVAPGEEASVLDLTALITDPDENDDHSFTVEGVTPAGFTVDLDDDLLVVSAAGDSQRGTTGSITLAVSDGTSPPAAGQVTVTIVASSRPLPRAVDDIVPAADQGEPVTVEVLANDANPFPDTPLRVVDAEAVSGDIAVSHDGSTVTVTPAGDFVGTATVRYAIRDQTDDPEREVDGALSVTVRGVPGQPAAPTVLEVRDRTAVLTWPAPPSNGAPILDYVLRSSDRYESTCAGTTCTLSDLQNDVTYRFTVTARNEVGAGEPSPLSATVRPDVHPDAPDAPLLTFGDSELDVTWTEPRSPGSAITGYDVEISPGGSVRVTGTSHTFTGLNNGQSYQVRVRAFNDAPDPSGWSPYSAPEVPASVPDQPAAPTATATGAELGGQIEVRWTAPADNGAPIEGYTLTVFRNGALHQTISPLPGNSTVISAQNASDYTFAIAATNRAGDSSTSAESNEVRPFGAPDVVRSVTAVDGDQAATLTYLAPSDNGQPIERYEVLYDGGRVETLPGSNVVGGLSNGKEYSFQLRACNSYCGAWGPVSNTVTPYGPPGLPEASASASGIRVTFNWSPPAPNGRPIDRLEISVNGESWENVGPGPGSRTVGESQGGGVTHSIQVRAVDTDGQSATSSASARTADPYVRVERGSPHFVTGCPNCYRIKVQIYNFAPGDHTARYYDDGGQPGDPQFPDQVIRADSNGYGIKDGPNFYGYPGTNVWVVVDGVRSPDYRWPS